MPEEKKYAPSADVPRRLELLREQLELRRLDAFLVLREVNVHYLSGFEGTESALLIGRRGKVLVTDGRFREEASISAPGFRAVIRRYSLIEEAARQARLAGWFRLGYELHGMTAAEHEDFLHICRLMRPRLKPIGLRTLVEDMRAVKSELEIEAIRRAVRLAEAASGVARRLFRAGATELAIARGVARNLEDRGASGAAFDVIAALDARASLPHARPSEARATRRSLLLLDWGARWARYASDLTRVFTASSIPSWFRRAHEVVLRAQAAAIERIGPGVRASDVDKAARDVLRKAGFDREFSHGVGHGLGLEVHEAPRLSPRSEDVLKEGMVVTIEPGIYIPGRGGVRIEDDVLVGPEGAVVLSHLSRALD